MLQIIINFFNFYPKNISIYLKINQDAINDQSDIKCLSVLSSVNLVLIGYPIITLLVILGIISFF